MTVKTEKNFRLSLNPKVLNTYYVLDTILGPGDIAVIKPSDLKNYVQCIHLQLEDYGRNS